MSTKKVSSHYFLKQAKFKQKTILVIQRVVISIIFSMATMNIFAGGTQLPTSPWNGFYIGGQLGVGWNHAKWHFSNRNYFNTLGVQLIGNDFSFNPVGISGGGNVGYNYQTGSFIFGLDGAVLGTNFNAANPSPFFPTINIFSLKMHLLVTLQGRIGYVIKKHWLAYIMGGWAGGRASLSFLDTSANVRAASTRWVNGFTVGTGVDYKITHRFSVGINYNYIKLYFNNTTISCPACGTGIGLGTPIVNGRLKTHIILAHLNYFISNTNQP